MKSIALFGCLIAVCSVGGVAAPASAKSGGGGAAAAVGFHAGMRAGGPRPVLARGFAPRRAFRGINLRRRQIPILPYWPAYGDFDPFYYDPPTDAAVGQEAASFNQASEPVAPSQVPLNRVLVVTPGCRTQEQKVQSAAGGEQIVRITRCY